MGQYQIDHYDHSSPDKVANEQRLKMSDEIVKNEKLPEINLL